MSPGAGKRALLMLPNFRGGGAEKNMLRYGELLLGAGYEVVFVTISDRRNHELVQGARYEVLPPIPKWAGLFKRWYLAHKLHRKIKELGGEKSFNLKVSTLPAMDKVVRRAGLRDVIFRIANNPEPTRPDLQNQGRQERNRRRWKGLYARQKLLCVSEDLERTVRGILSRDDAAIRTIYNPFDLAGIRRSSELAIPGKPNEEYIIHVGRFSAQKRLDLLFEAYKRSGIAPKLVLLCKFDAKLATLIENEGLRDRVIHPGYQTNPYPWIRGARALVLTSDWEGLPGVLIEALICGTPVVSTDCPSGPAEILVGPLREFLVPMRNVDAIADALRRVLAAPPVITEDMVKRFSHEQFLEGLEAFAEEKTPRL